MGVRVGTTREIEMYSGNIGYHVYPPRAAGASPSAPAAWSSRCSAATAWSRVWITCNPDNHASRRTCERLGRR
jgi:tagatose 1,6-diphosphate aldolase